MNRKQIYQFKLQADSAVYFGGGESGKLIKNGDNTPFITGNSIGGAFRQYLIQANVPNELILYFMGGSSPIDSSSQENENVNERSLIESRIFISDGTIDHVEEKLVLKEGTAIDESYGSALPKHKYEHEYLKAGFTLCFQIECDFESWSPGGSSSEDFLKIIGTWAVGINAGSLRFGGKKSNDFGKFSVVTIEETAYSFNSIEALDDYIFNRNKDYIKTNMKELELEKLEQFEPNSKSIFFSLQGSFPYGVYQSFADLGLEQDVQKSRVVTGPLRKNNTLEKDNSYYIPASSLKGLLSNEFKLLLLQMFADKEDDDIRNLIDSCCNELFGSTEQRGKLIVSDMLLDEQKAKPVSIDRPCKPSPKDSNERPSDLPIYVKIDRLTGGVISSALKHQNEVQGDAQWKLELLTKENTNYAHFLFPLIYILRRIGSGEVPIGGRTVIGLGQFDATTTVVTDAGNKHVIANKENLQGDNREWLESSFGHFKKWLESSYEAFEGR